jgi:D-3-phosphoglycerate dehydrogenase
MSFKVAIVILPDRIPENIVKCVEAEGAEVTLYTGSKASEEIISVCRDADFIISFQEYFPFTHEVLKQLPKVRFIQTLGIGFDEVDLDVVNEYGIGLNNLRGFCIEELAEHALALIMVCARWIVVLHNRVRAGNTVQPAGEESVRHMSVLKGKTLGTVGFGNSARTLVPKARSFEMRILSYDPYVDEHVFKEMNVEKVSLDKLLEESDFISIHANLTAENRHMFGLEQFKKMKRNAFIINTSRGGFINEQELCTALDAGYIAGAGLDVTEQEPVPVDSPLMKYDNVILTGHNAGTSFESKARASTQPAEEVARVLRGEWPIGLVNPVIKEKYVAKWGPMKEPGT